MIPPWVLSIIWPEALFQASFKAPGRICLGLECHVFAKGSHRIPASESTHWVCTCSLSRFLLPFPNLQILAPDKLLLLFYLPFSNTFTDFSSFFPPCPHGSQYFSLHSSPLFNFSTFLHESLPGLVIVFLFFPGLPLFSHSCLHICLLSPFLYFSLQFWISFHKR